MSTLKVTNLQHPSAASANVTLDSSGNADFNGKNLAGVASVNGSQLGGNRNLIINGEMQVAQRGTSVTSTGAGSTYDCIDRYETYKNSSFAPNYTISQDSTGPTGFSKSLKIEVDATATPTAGQNFGIRTKIEGYDSVQTGLGTSGSKQVTLSFYVKSNKTGTYGIQLFRYGSTTYSTTKAYTVDASDTWERKEITFTALTTDNTPSVGSSEGIMLGFDLSSGPDDISDPFDWTATGVLTKTVTGQVNLMDSTSNYWQITGVQLEVGDTATSFEHEDYGTTLQKCQRYYQELGTDGGQETFASGAWYATTNAFGFMPFKKPMRTSPSITAPTATNGYKCYNGGSTALASTLVFERISDSNARVKITTSGGTVGRGTWFELNAVSPCNILLDAEL